MDLKFPRLGSVIRVDIFSAPLMETAEIQKLLLKLD